MSAKKNDPAYKKITDQLNHLLKLELEGANRCLHHSFMVFGFSRDPIVKYFRGKASEALDHAALLGEKIVALGGHPQVRIEATWEPEKHSVQQMLEINLEAEKTALAEYTKLLALVPKDDIALEELVRSQILKEQDDVEEIEKYLRPPTGN
ncbi:MAG: ferritin-like domain-containing protein [Bdellovibrionota bacterium]